MFKLLDNIVDEIGVEHVVQVVTHGVSNFVVASRMLMEREPNCFGPLVQLTVMI